MFDMRRRESITLIGSAAGLLQEDGHAARGTFARLALLFNRQQHVDLFAHSTRSAPLGQRTAFAHGSCLRTVQIATLGRARYRDLHWVAGKLGLPGRLCWNRHGLDMNAAGLRRDVVAVF
jgi:hypothetical protein